MEKNGRNGRLVKFKLFTQFDAVSRITGYRPNRSTWLALTLALFASVLFCRVTAQIETSSGNLLDDPYVTHASRIQQMTPEEREQYDRASATILNPVAYNEELERTMTPEESDARASARWAILNPFEAKTIADQTKTAAELANERQRLREFLNPQP